MQILINSDNRVKGGDSATSTVESIVESAVEHFSERITRVEVHLSDTNGPKHGDHQKRAVIEARVAGLKPVAVTHEAPSMMLAIEGAADRLKRALEHAFGRADATSKPHHNLENLESLEGDTAP